MNESRTADPTNNKSFIFGICLGTGLNLKLKQKYFVLDFGRELRGTKGAHVAGLGTI